MVRQPNQNIETYQSSRFARYFVVEKRRAAKSTVSLDQHGHSNQMDARQKWRLNLVPESVSVVATDARRRHHNQRLELEYDEPDPGSYQPRVLAGKLRASRCRSGRIRPLRNRTQVVAGHPV
jgi:hypothetical protein